MAARKRNKVRIELDRVWVAGLAGQGMSPCEIYRRSQEKVDVADFPVLKAEDFEGLNQDEVGVAIANAGKQRQEAINEERHRRESIKDLSERMVYDDIRVIRQRTITVGTDKYAPVLDRTIKELQRLAFADLRDVVEWGPEGSVIVDSMELSEASAACVSSVTSKKTTTTAADGSTSEVFDTKIDTHSKVRALRQLLQYLKPAGPVVSLTVGGDANVYASGMLRNLKGDPEEREGGS